MQGVDDKIYEDIAKLQRAVDKLMDYKYSALVDAKGDSREFLEHVLYERGITRGIVNITGVSAALQDIHRLCGEITSGSEKVANDIHTINRKLGHPNATLHPGPRWAPMRGRRKPMLDRAVRMVRG